MEEERKGVRMCIVSAQGVGRGVKKAGVDSAQGKFRVGVALPLIQRLPDLARRRCETCYESGLGLRGFY